MVKGEIGLESPWAERLRRSEKGVALIEFAVIAPIFVMILAGIVAYGGYFWRAHSLQQIANDAARTALPGLTANEREELARDIVMRELEPLAGLPSDKAEVSISEANDTLVVTLVYDASNDAFLQLGLIPLPDRRIRRTAAIRLGGL